MLQRRTERLLFQSWNNLAILYNSMSCHVTEVILMKVWWAVLWFSAFMNLFCNAGIMLQNISIKCNFIRVKWKNYSTIVLPCFLYNVTNNVWVFCLVNYPVFCAWYHGSSGFYMYPDYTILFGHLPWYYHFFCTWYYGNTVFICTMIMPCIFGIYHDITILFCTCIMIILYFYTWYHGNTDLLYLQ